MYGGGMMSLLATEDAMYREEEEGRVGSWIQDKQIQGHSKKDGHHFPGKVGKRVRDYFILNTV